MWLICCRKMKNRVSRKTRVDNIKQWTGTLIEEWTVISCRKVGISPYKSSVFRSRAGVGFLGGDSQPPTHQIGDLGVL